ncbi:MAG: hypothetical protein JWO38_4309 [Gemmataceae bacterium]|nr:hypothetical protein [Gemmataceae bacterium]
MARGSTSRLRWVAALITGLLVQQGASGFYFRGWPAGPKDPPTLVLAGGATTKGPTSQVHDPSGGGTGPPSSTHDPVPGDGNQHGDPGPTLPEPGTAALVAIGLGMAAIARRGRRKFS